MALSPPVFVALTSRGAALARRLQPDFPGSLVHGFARRVETCDVAFDDANAHLAMLFTLGTPIVAIASSGIVIRALAPHLADKRDEPPVVALAEDCGSIVPLIGGHRGGNALARRLAALTGGHAAITTAGDLALGIALDDPPPGWRIATPDMLKGTAAALIAGEAATIESEVGRTAWLDALLPPHGGARAQSGLRLVVTTRAAPRPGALVYHPPRLVLGIGCERNADPDAVVAFVRRALAEADRAEGAIACVVSIDLKLDEAALHAVATTLDVPARFFSAAELAAQESRLATPSSYVKSVVGVAGVAEAAALAGAGADATLVLSKQIGPRATLALTQASEDIDATRIGRARGRLDIVGIGPGPAAWRTPAASEALLGAEDVVGYGLYLDLLGPLIAGKRQHARALGEEEARVKLALDLAATGKRIALVSSGDAGIYALATLVHELVERGDDPLWRRIAIVTVPGVSAMQAAAARAGAPRGPDFGAISLADLLTPRAPIERRLQAAIDGDFVLAHYTPASLKRRAPLDMAVALLRAGRPATTPVVIARNLGRADELVRVVTLGALDPAEIDMLTLLIIGSSATRCGPSGVFTPRGYAQKPRSEENS